MSTPVGLFHIKVRFFSYFQTNISFQKSNDNDLWKLLASMIIIYNTQKKKKITIVIYEVTVMKHLIKLWVNVTN